ncbi:MAG: hypothetical protein ACTSYO_10190 [Candidatus Ranarchaeia archaeon]
MQRSWMEEISYAIGGVALVSAITILLYLYHAFDTNPRGIPSEIFLPSMAITLLFILMGIEAIVLTRLCVSIKNRK